MAARGISSVELRNPRDFMAILSSAACEWFLIFMLFVDAALSYLLRKFAQYCDLQTPCPLCSRIEHVFGEHKHGYYWKLLCYSHREEISSSVYCNVHNKLADVHAVCSDCLMSFNSMTQSNSESDRLLVAKLGIDIEESSLKTLLLNKHSIADSSGPRNCSCCERLLKVKSNAQRLLEATTTENGASKANVKPPLPRVPSHSRFSRRDSLKKIRDKISDSVAPHLGGVSVVDSLSHVGYTELRLSSDTESEFPFSDDDEVASVLHESNDSRTESDIQQDLTQLPKVVADDSIPGSQNQTSEPLPSVFYQPVQLESRPANLESAACENYGFQEHNSAQPNEKPITSRSPELTTLNYGHQFVEKPIVVASAAQPSNISLLSEVLSISDVVSSSNAAKVSGKSDVTGTEENASISVADDASSISMSNHVNSTITLSNTGKDRKESGMGLEPLRIKKFSARAEEALKSPLRITSSIVNRSQKISSPRFPRNHDGQFSSPRYPMNIDGQFSSPRFPINHEGYFSSPRFLGNPDGQFYSPRFRMNHDGQFSSPRFPSSYDGLQRNETFGVDAVDMLQLAAALERHDYGQESVDGINVKEIEGETVVDRLKRQVEYDKRCMKALFRELDEERGASAISANQAMAMITRLQEEKAALHMEALQYLRMMEEQAEYDMEALEKANELLAEREKEMQDLEAELEMYRNNAVDKPLADHPREGISSENVESKMADNHPTANVHRGTTVTADKKSSDILKDKHKYEKLTMPELDFEDEKMYISQCLERMEKLCRNEAPVNLENGQYSDKLIKGVDVGEELAEDTQIQINHHNGENGLPLQNDLCASNGKPRKDMDADIVEVNHLGYEESECLDAEQDRYYADGSGNKLGHFIDDIIDLKNRLQALETSHDILEHALKSLNNGNDGLNFIREIACQLQELRNFEFKKRMADTERETSDTSL